MNAKTLHIPMKLKLQNWYRLEAIKVDAAGNQISSRIAADWFPNLITNKGLDNLGAANAVNAVQVGSGSTAPAFTDSALASYVAGVVNSSAGSAALAGTSPNYYGSQTFIYTFAVGAAAGNLTEVGVGPSTSASTLSTRALILDGGGAPTTITILSDEILKVTVEFRLYYQQTDWTGSVTISGVSYDVTLRASNVDSSDAPYLMNLNSAPAWSQIYLPPSANSFVTQTLGAITGSGPSGTGTNVGSTSVATYISGSYSMDFTCIWDISNGNAAIGSVLIYTNRGAYQASFTPTLPKDNTKKLTLVFTISWARE